LPGFDTKIVSAQASRSELRRRRYFSVAGLQTGRLMLLWHCSDWLNYTLLDWVYF